MDAIDFVIVEAFTLACFAATLGLGDVQAEQYTESRPAAGQAEPLQATHKTEMRVCARHPSFHRYAGALERAKMSDWPF